MITTDPDILRRERLLAIASTPALADFLRDRYPDCQVSSTSSMLAGIDELARQRMRAVIVYVDVAQPQLSDGVAGLREAAGEQTKVLLCCNPETEPCVREVIDAGADDYLLWPLEGGELDKALDYAYVTGSAFEEPQVPAASLEEIELLGDLLAGLDQEPFSLLCKLADLIRLAMGSEAVTIVVEGSAATSGGTVAEPVLVEPIKRRGKAVGQITIGHRREPYHPSDRQKLEHYARLSAHLLSAADNQRRWRSEALTDVVSALPNRRYVQRFLDELLHRAGQERFRVTVLLFDIDDFKAYNDSFGHAAGDEIIRRIGQLFQAHCREHDVVTRYGGDEFCVVFWDADQPRVAGSTHPSDALSVLARFQEALKSYDASSLGAKTPGRLTISGGLASFPWDASSTSELIAKADQALLQAKQAGKNRVFTFDSRRATTDQSGQHSTV